MATGQPRFERWKNGGLSSINDAGGISAVDTSVVVSSAASFPTRGDFRIKIGSEIIIVTAVSGSTFTIERGADGTTAAIHSDGASVTHVVSEDSLDRAFADNYGIDYTNGFPYNRIDAEGVTKVASDFTWLNQGSATCTDADDGGLVMTTGASEAIQQLRGKYLAVPGSTPWYCAAYIHLGNGMARYDGAGAGTTGGLFMRESSSSELYTCFIRSDISAMWRMTNPTTFSADVDTFVDNENEEMWIRIGDDGVDVFGELSFNGYDWEECWNESRTSFMAGGPDQIGFYMMNGNADVDAEVYIKSWHLYT